jgi:ubiquitin
LPDLAAIVAFAGQAKKLHDDALDAIDTGVVAPALTIGESDESADLPPCGGEGGCPADLSTDRVHAPEAGLRLEMEVTLG